MIASPGAAATPPSTDAAGGACRPRDASRPPSRAVHPRCRSSPPHRRRTAGRPSSGSAPARSDLHGRGVGGAQSPTRDQRRSWHRDDRPRGARGRVRSTRHWQLRQLHRLTPGWPQRPGWRSSTDLLHAETGTKIDLGAMPPEGVARCRAAWARLVGRQTCVVHGDPNPRNIRMTADRVALIDWDESHVDVPDLDLVLPHNAAGLNGGAHDIAAQASAAWEAAVCWDDAYAIKRLAQVRAV